MRTIRPTPPITRARSPRSQSSLSKTRDNKAIMGSGQCRDSELTQEFQLDLWYLCMCHLHMRRSRSHCHGCTWDFTRIRSTKRQNSRGTGTPRPTCRRTRPGRAHLRCQDEDAQETDRGEAAAHLQLAIASCKYPNRRVHEPHARTQDASCVPRRAQGIPT